MKFDHASIARIFLGDKESVGFVGTGFLVTSDHVMTCGHVVGNYGKDAVVDLRLSFGDDSAPAAQRKGAVVAYGSPDLALITLDKPVMQQPMLLVSGLTSEYEAAISQIRGSVVGFSQTQNLRLIERRIEHQISLAWDFHTQHLVGIQFSGGLLRGMSGSPFIVEFRNRGLCFGMARMGGDDRAITSQLITSDSVISFLTRNGVFPQFVQASDCLSRDVRQKKVISDASDQSGSHETSRSLKVFLCHFSGDKPTVRGLYSRLKADGFQPWLDEKDLLPGQDWRREITSAVRSSDVVLVCLTMGFNDAGYRQKEIRLALDVAEEQPEGAIFLIPVKLEECEVPQRLSGWHWVNLFDDDGYEKLVGALTSRAKEGGINTKLDAVDDPFVSAVKEIGKDLLTARSSRQLRALYYRLKGVLEQYPHHPNRYEAQLLLESIQRAEGSALLPPEPDACAPSPHMTEDHRSAQPAWPWLLLMFILTLMSVATVATLGYARVLIHPWALTGYVLFLAFGLLAVLKRKRHSLTGSLIAVVAAAFLLFGGLFAAYRNAVERRTNVPTGATAKCKDATYSYAGNTPEACSHHGGVEFFINPAPGMQK